MIILTKKLMIMKILLRVRQKSFELSIFPKLNGKLVWLLISKQLEITGLRLRSSERESTLKAQEHF